MPKLSNTAAANFFNFAINQTLDWEDRLPEDFETSSVQSFDSDASEDFWENFDPEVEKQIIKNHAQFLNELTARANKDLFDFLVKTEAQASQERNQFLDQLTRNILETTPLVLEALRRKEKIEETKVLPKIPSPMPGKKLVKDSFANFWKFAVKQNGKEPTCKWRDPANQTKASFDPNRFNTGVPTGSRNNLLVVDLDVKDDGVEEFGAYLAQHGQPQTLTVKTASGGYHYYFNYSHADPDTELMIKTFLKNASKYRGKGIDVRSEGGYVVAPPSLRDGRAYEVTNPSKPSDIPICLVTWLLEGRGATAGSPTNRQTKTTKQQAKKATDLKQSQVEYDFDLDDATATEILNELPGDFLTNFSDWFRVTGIMKKHGLKNAWEQWSKRAANYDQTKNEQIWNSSAGILDINYLIFLLRRAGSQREFVAKWKPYHPITQDLGNVKQIVFNKPFVSEGLSRETFESYETIIIKSCTGTGKTTAIAKHMESHTERDTKFLSITTRTSLADQHEKSFKNLRMKNYQDIKTNLYDAEALGICLNSLIKLDALDEDEIKNYIVYIDEVSSFTEFTNNDLLDGILKRIVSILTRLMKHAKKVIVSDALINDSTFELLKHRPLEKTVFLTNSFKKFEGVPAVRLRSEEDFLNKLLEHCLAGSPFLFGSDSCNVATAFYHHCLEHVADQALRARFLLITAETGTRIKDASEEFKDKFVFYSPKITFGVDFSSLTSQDVFIHITGNSLQPSGSYQQTTRCRNIRTLYYFGECSSDLSFYDSLAEVRADVEQAIATSKTFNATCTYLDEFDQIQVVRNTFFNLYCLNEFTRDTFASNMIKHFELLLKANGFQLSAQGQKQLLSVAGMVEEINEKTFEAWLANPDCSNPRFNQLFKNIDYLNLDPFDRETLTKFKDIVMNRRRVEDHDATVRFLKSDEHVDSKIADLSFNCLEAKATTNTYQKIKLLRAAEAKWGFTSLETEMKDFTKIDEPMFKLISHAFRLRRANPNTQEEAAKLYKTLVNKLTFNNLLRYTRAGGFLWSTEAVKTHLDLNKFKNKRVYGFAAAVVSKFGLTPEAVPQGLFCEDLDA